MFQGGPCLSDITNTAIINVLPIHGCKHFVYTTDLKSTAFQSSLIAVVVLISHFFCYCLIAYFYFIISCNSARLYFLDGDPDVICDLVNSHYSTLLRTPLPRHT